MFRNDFSIMNDYVPRCHSLRNSQFLKQIMYEERKIRALRAQEISMTSENPKIKEHKENEQIYSEINKLERETFLEEKRKVLLNQNEDEIRELAVKLKRAEVQRQLVEQMTSKENKTKEEMQARLEENKRFAEECKRIKENALEEERISAQKKAALRQELLMQIQEKDKKRDVEKQIIEKERENRKKILDRFQQDIDSDKRQMQQLKEMLRQDIDEYLQKNELYKKQKQIETQEDHRMYMEISRQRDEQKKLRLEKRKRAMQERAALSERIGQHIANLQMEKQKHNDLLLELLIAERLAKENERFKINLETRKQRAKSLQQDFQTLFLTRQQEIALKRDDEKKLALEQLKVQQSLERKANDIKKCRLPSKKQYRQELLDMIEYKDKERAFQASQYKIESAQQLALQNKRQQEIEAEKLRLLKEQRLDILKFLPINTISAEHRSLLTLTCKETKANI